MSSSPTTHTYSPSPAVIPYKQFPSQPIFCFLIEYSDT
jgi:hypothetical protein